MEAISEHLVLPLKFAFQREDVLVPRSWEAAGNDPIGDFFSAWDACFGNVKRFNKTHFVLENRGAPYYFEQTHEMVPELAPLYPFPFSPLEEHFEGSPMSSWMRTYYEIPIYTCVVYLLAIVVGKIVMSALPAFDLKVSLLLWNLLLSAFSFCGAIRTVPHLLATISEKGIYYSICIDVGEGFGAGAAGFWSFLFILSKFPELLDTAFIIFRKKPLIFLHWWHHFTVLLYVWQSYSTQSSAGIWFIAMNYFVHSWMYLYYGLASWRLWPRKIIPPWVITILQLSQMVVGVFVCVKIYQYKQAGLECSTSDVSFKSGVAMYFSYFLLFLQVLFQVLSRSSAPKQKSKTE